MNARELAGWHKDLGVKAKTKLHDEDDDEASSRLDCAPEHVSAYPSTGWLVPFRRRRIARLKRAQGHSLRVSMRNTER